MKRLFLWGLLVVMGIGGYAVALSREAKSVVVHRWRSLEVVPFAVEGLSAGVDALEGELRSLDPEDLSVPGVPSDDKNGFRRLRISSYPGPVDGVVAAAAASRQEIMVDLSEFYRLPPEERLQVLRHEAAHIALAQFFGHETIPTWLNEGFAEWAAPDPTCMDRVRLRLEFLRRSRKRLVWPRVTDPTERLSGRLHRDYLASFFRFLDRRRPNVVGSGHLLRAVQDLGLDSGFRETFGNSLEALEGEWLDEQRGLPVAAGPGCPAATGVPD